MYKWSSLIRLALFAAVWFAAVWAVCSYAGFWWAFALIVAMEIQSIGAWFGWWPDHIRDFIHK